MSSVADLFAVLPLDAAMPQLRPETKAPEASVVSELAATIPPLQAAALFVYVDDLDSAHRIVQDSSDSTAAWLHAVIHRREGDFSNSLYWYGKARENPLVRQIGKSPREFVAAAANGEDPELLEVQRQEWRLIYEHAVSEGI